MEPPLLNATTDRRNTVLASLQPLLGLSVQNPRPAALGGLRETALQIQLST